MFFQEEISSIKIILGSKNLSKNPFRILVSLILPAEVMDIKMQS